MRLGDILRTKSKGEGPKESGTEPSSWREEVQSLPIEEIRKNPFQPRREFDQVRLKELADSVQEHGILHPVVVRQKEQGFELVIGERRLRACRMLGWESIPALVREMTDAEVAEIALIENLQREDLGFFEEAEGYSRLLEEFGLTQEELAGRLGKSQSAVANKLRLLRISPQTRRLISREMLTERHARALLRLSTEKEQLGAVETFVKNGLNVRQAEAWIEKRLLEADGSDDTKRRKQTVKGVYTDYRLLLNSVRKLVEQMKSDGVEVELEERDEQKFVEICIRVHRHQKGGR